MTTANPHTSILAIHMQEGFKRLAPLLQRAHLGDNKLEGIAQIRRGNCLAQALCKAFSFPKAGQDVPLRVDCYHTADAMIWNRNFNGLKMPSHFRRKGEYLVEHLGPLAMSFKAIEYNGQLQYRFVNTRFFGVPMPAILSPHITASEREVDGKYLFSVEVTMFLIGTVIAYSGELTIANPE